MFAYLMQLAWRLSKEVHETSTWKHDSSLSRVKAWCSTIVIFIEDDKLVKDFYQQAGKRMFSSNTRWSVKLALVIQYGVGTISLAIMMAQYIEDYHEVMTFPKINSDLFVLAYAVNEAARKT